MNREKTTATLLIVIFMISAFAVAVSVSAANPTTTVSSTMEFEGTLAIEDVGIYSGVIPMIVDGGYDIYAKEGASAWFGDIAPPNTVWTEEVVSDHDAWPTWDPDTPDWYQYSLKLSYDAESGEYKWAVRNHPSATAAHPWYDIAHWGGSGKLPRGVPMSGTIVLRKDGTSYAYETDVGAYLEGTGTGEIPGGAALYGGGAACWDMDWSWGSEVVPLEYPGFDVAVDDLGSNNYHVTLTPAPARGPQIFDMEYYSTQFQWRAKNGQFGDWTGNPCGYVSDSYKLTGNALHTQITYAPAVEGERGTSAVYINDKKSGHWILNEGKTSYIYDPLYSPYRVVNYFRGYMDFSGTPKHSTFTEGILYQWIYVMKPQNEPVTDTIDYAEWDPVMNAWLVGFSIYIYDPQIPSPSHDIPEMGSFADFPRPVPGNYDPYLLLQ